MNSRLIVVFSVLFLPALLSCSMKKLGDEMKRADATYGYIKLAAPARFSSGERILVVLYKQVDGGRKMVDFRTMLAGEEAAVFLVPLAGYDIVAFHDINGDFIYQQTEPAQLINNVPVNMAIASGDHSLDTITDAVILNLSAGANLAFPVDLTIQSPY